MRPTAAARAFVAEWAALAKHFATHEPAEVERHSGVDQAALNRALEQNSEAAVLRLPCRIWNATQTEWARADADTRVVHVKSALRRACLSHEPTPDGCEWLVERWRQFEQAS
jgi:hypothetical protein